MRKAILTVFVLFAAVRGVFGQNGIIRGLSGGVNISLSYPFAG